MQPLLVRPEAAVDEADRHVVAGGDDQALAIEVELREDGVLEQRRRDRLQHPALRRLAAPDRGEVGRIGVAEGSKAIHEASPCQAAAAKRCASRDYVTRVGCGKDAR